MVRALRGLGKQVYGDVVILSDSAYGQSWLVIDDEVDSSFYGDDAIPYTVRPWLYGEGVPDRVKGAYVEQHGLDPLLRATFEAIRLAATLDRPLDEVCEALSQLGARLDRLLASAVFEALQWIAREDFELGELHWIDWRVRSGVLASLVVRVALDPVIQAENALEDAMLDRGWGETTGPAEAAAIRTLALAAARLRRPGAWSLLLGLARFVPDALPPLEDDETVGFLLSRSAETVRAYETVGGELHAVFGQALVGDPLALGRVLSRVVAAVAASPEDRRAELHRTAVRIAFCFLADDAEAFEAAVASAEGLDGLAQEARAYEVDL
ncbi:MAG: hypothetical protein R3F59_18935 [Myxococcota bacterium]